MFCALLLLHSSSNAADRFYCVCFRPATACMEASDSTVLQNSATCLRPSEGTDCWNKSRPKARRTGFFFLFFFYLWLRRGGQRRGRFTRRRSPLLKRMRAGMCLMIHRPASLRKPKWILRICSSL